MSKLDLESMLVTALAGEYERLLPHINVLVVSQEVSAPEDFPCVAVGEMDNRTHMAGQDGEIGERFAERMIQLDFYSAINIGARRQCRQLADIAHDYLMDNNFVRTSFMQTDNIDNTIYRMTARYEVIVQEDDTLYRVRWA